MARTYGYIRTISADDVTLDTQVSALRDAGVVPGDIFDEVCLGTATHRPGLAACLAAVQPGETLVVWRLDRLATTLGGILAVLEALQTRGVGLLVLSGDLAGTHQGSVPGPALLAWWQALAACEGTR